MQDLGIGKSSSRSDVASLCLAHGLSRPACRDFPQVFMDDLTDIDEAIGAVKVAVLIPTCGEKTAVVLKALFGNLQLR